MATKRKTPSKTERINVRVLAATKRSLERKAARERRTVADYVRILLERSA